MNDHSLVDNVPSNNPKSPCHAQLYIFENSRAVTRMIIMLRERTELICVNLGHVIYIHHVRRTNEQLAEIPTKVHLRLRTGSH